MYNGIQGMGIKYCEASNFNWAPRIELREIYAISLFIADKTGDTSKILLEVRSSHPAVFFKNYVLQNFANFTREDLGWSHFLVKL